MRRIAWLLPLAILVASIGGAIQGQAAPSPKKYFTAGFDPPSVAAGATSTATLRLTNSTSSQTTLGSANVTIPFGWSVVSNNQTATVYTAAGSPTARTWSVSVPDQAVSRTIGISANISSNALSPGETLRVPLTVTAPCSGTSTWTTYVKQSNDFNGTGNDFTLQGSQPTLSVSPGQAQTLTFDQQPSNSVKGSAISPAVKVKLVDSCGNSVTTPANVTMSIGNDANPTTALGGTTTQTSTSTGVATFNDLTLDHNGTGFTLRATSGSLSVESAPFNVYDQRCDAAAQQTCHGEDAAKTTFVDVTLPKTGTGFTSLSFSGLGRPFDCGSAGTTYKGAVTTLDPPPGYDWPNYLTTTFRYDKSVAPGTGVSNFVFCLSKPSWPAYRVIGDCPKTLKESSLPCMSKRIRNGAGDLVLTMLLTSGDPIGGVG